jgi:cytochrome P450
MFGPHEWFPFGGGKLVCLGMPFALYEMKALLATLISQRRLNRHAGRGRGEAVRSGLRAGRRARVVVRESTR